MVIREMYSILCIGKFGYGTKIASDCSVII